LEKVDVVREEALKILVKVFESKSYSNILIKNLSESFSSLDKAFITDMVYGTIKWKLKIDNAIENLSKIKLNKISPYILNILRLGIYQIDYMSKVPQSAAVNECVKLARKYGNAGAVKYVNGLLRNYCRNKNSVSYPNKREDAAQYLSIFYSFPKWMVEKLICQYGEDFTEDFLRASNEVPPLSIRVNNLKISKEDLKRSLSEKGIEVEDGKYLEDALYLKGVPGIANLDEYKKGYFTVQDESSMAAVLALSPEPGEFIMDLCSAPGTKSTYMGELMANKGRIISGDLSQGKLKLVEDNGRRLGLDIIETICHDASKVMEEYVGKADRVLVDAPCSGLGIMRKKPEIRWNREISHIEDISKLQKSILNVSGSYVKSGGILVYSTCTLLKEENIEVVEDFLKNNSNFVVDDIPGTLADKLKKGILNEGFMELYPNRDGIDGFFIARLKRVD